jgi:hypothetical protein
VLGSNRTQILVRGVPAAGDCTDDNEQPTVDRGDSSCRPVSLHFKRPPGFLSRASLSDGFVPLIIDAATGSWNQLDNTTVRCSLEQAEVEKVPVPRARAETWGDGEYALIVRSLRRCRARKRLRCFWTPGELSEPSRELLPRLQLQPDRFANFVSCASRGG